MFISLLLVSDDSVFGSIPSLFKVVNKLGMTLVWSSITFSIFYALCLGEIKKEESINEDKLIA
ncbi:hypothetical protein [Priestia aryabhattai]|uniref:hypothetical protein n=1 Tax=Priestia aryabhattai TaxID=412384 RepID=UPI001ADA7993|nr:hypothetical protein [Priestia aryabhattai]QTL52584.1 hypothetical protein J5Z55_29485 [Priestia aryabhattai]